MKRERQISAMLGFSIKQPIRRNFWAFLTDFMNGSPIGTEHENLYSIICLIKKGIDHEA